ncbi:hypothetical protein ARMGADRAFT_1081027 [Armillaria gallica]|uniref:Uncharacterized protein n=1 Tax=Armillaria gallica TaxID=47427 RepID=A0A2H3DAK6_ARMGA|nr:hypothetical protein ARMGADRAFT_1081027 [Armillaria gallica]
MPASDQPASDSTRASAASSMLRFDVVWDNLNLPYTAFFSRRGNPYRPRMPDLVYSSVTCHDDKQRVPLRRDSSRPDPQGETQGETPTNQKWTSDGTQSPRQPDKSETNWQKRQKQTEASPLPSASAEDNPLDTLSMEICGEVVPPPAPPHQATPLSLGWALYLLSTGRLTAVPEVLHHAPILDLFNHFIQELVEDPNWAETPAGLDYTHYGYSYILKEEARHFACITWNMLHQEQRVEVPACYRWPSPDISLIATTPKPMPSYQPPWSGYVTYEPTYSYIYPRGYGPPDLQSYVRPFTSAGTDQLVPPQPPAQPPAQLPVPPQQLNQPAPGPPPLPPPGPPLRLPAGPR